MFIQPIKIEYFYSTNQINSNIFQEMFKLLKRNFQLPDYLSQSSLNFLQPKPRHVIHINSFKNNTLISLTMNGNVVMNTSSGSVGLKKAARKTSDAGYQAMMHLLQSKKEYLQNKRVELWFKGFGRGRDMCFRACKTWGLNICKVVDVTGIRHGGCRPKKKRRL